MRVREMADEHAEARWVTAEIERLVDEGVSRAEIAVFYRTNAQSRVLEDMLVRAQVAYQVIGGTKFYERAEIRDAVAYLTFLVNPQDGNAFTRVANSPRRGLGPTSLGRVLGTRTRWGCRSGRPRPARSRGWRPPRGGRSARFMDVDGGPARAGRGGRAGRRSVIDDVLDDTGLPRGAARPSGRSRRRAGSRTSRSSSRRRPRVRRNGADGGSVGEFLQQTSLLADADIDPRRRGPRDADDDAQRQGPRVPDRLHDRDGGRRVPALALDRGGQRRGGAAARRTSG